MVLKLIKAYRNRNHHTKDLLISSLFRSPLTGIADRSDGIPITLFLFWANSCLFFLVTASFIPGVLLLNEVRDNVEVGRRESAPGRLWADRDVSSLDLGSGNLRLDLVSLCGEGQWVIEGDSKRGAAVLWGLSALVSRLIIVSCLVTLVVGLVIDLLEGLTRPLGDWATLRLRVKLWGWTRLWLWRRELGGVE